MNLKTLPFLAAALLGVAGCDISHPSSAINMAPGQYQKSSTTTTPDGTTMTQDNKTTVGYDNQGNKKAVVQTRRTSDPPGLFNKSTTGSTIIEER